MILTEGIAPTPLALEMRLKEKEKEKIDLICPPVEINYFRTKGSLGRLEAFVFGG